MSKVDFSDIDVLSLICEIFVINTVSFYVIAGQRRTCNELCSPRLFQKKRETREQEERSHRLCVWCCQSRTPKSSAALITGRAGLVNHSPYLFSLDNVCSCGMFTLKICICALKVRYWGDQAFKCFVHCTVTSRPPCLLPLGTTI